MKYILLLAVFAIVSVSCENKKKERLYIKCDTCNSTGRGISTCPDCNGSGRIKCDECDGTGKTGIYTCSECDGYGQFKCLLCKGNGEIKGNCGTCRGLGKIYLDE